MDKATVITLAIALWGAVLSTYQWIEARKEKRRIARVDLRQGFLTQMQTTSEPMLFISVANPGNKTITVQQPVLRLPDKRTLIFHVAGSDVQFPFDLPEGKTCRIWVTMNDIVKALHGSGFEGKTKIRGIVSDGVGTEFISKTMVIDVKKWMKE